MADLKELVEKLIKEQEIRKPNVYPKGEYIWGNKSNDTSNFNIK